MTTINDTFEIVWGEWDAARAAQEQEYLRELLAQIDEARASKDWQELKRLGYAADEDGPREGQYRWVFFQEKYQDLLADLALTPDQLATQMNEAASH